MEYLEFANEIAPHRIIGVVVNSDETSKSFDLEVSDINNVLLMSLDEMREYLCEKGSLLIGRQNTYFRNAFKNKIPLARESECILKDILIPTNEESQDGSYSFYLEKDLTMPGFPEIVNRLHLDRRCIKSENGIIESASKSAFRIKKPHMMDIIIDQQLEQHNADPGRKSKEVKLGGELYVNDGQTNNFNQLEILRHFEKWQIIERNELLSLYNLLPQELITNIKKVIGMKLLYYDISSAHMPKNRNSITIRIRKPKVISTFDDVKIFTSVIVKNEARAYRNIFGIRVEYQNKENPYIVIHRIGPARKHFEFSIPWMLIGYEENLPIEPFIDDPIDYIWTKNYHFRNNAENNATKICCYQYDPQTEQIRNTLKFEINYAIIPDTPIFKVTSPVEHEWKYRPCRLQYPLKNSRTFTGNKCLLNTRQKAIFASIHYSDVQGHPLLLNVHKKYPIRKSLNNVPKNFSASVGYVEI
ncbi:3374_t:CDS:2 [Gigaspora rosea]|nr:3374_t:CDS:2 [Gigaspora rosea]